jgi:hypothetical protein
MVIDGDMKTTDVHDLNYDMEMEDGGGSEGSEGYTGMK